MLNPLFSHAGVFKIEPKQEIGLYKAIISHGCEEDSTCYHQEIEPAGIHDVSVIGF